MPPCNHGTRTSPSTGSLTPRERAGERRTPLAAPRRPTRRGRTRSGSASAGGATPDGRHGHDRHPQPAGRGEEEDEEAEEAPAGPPPARVFVVFRGVSWEDPQGGLRESDSIQGVFASEEAARRAVAALEREGGAGAESWYQPYPVQD